MGVTVTPPPPPPERDPLDEPDRLELEFRRLEAEVTARDCTHDQRVDVSVIGEDLRRWLCPTCSRRWTEEP